MRVNQILETNLSNHQFSVEQLSRELFVHPSNLYRKLKALTGKKPNQYIRSFRMAKAKKLLADPSLPIAAVAFETGFSSSEYFSRVFKKEVGMTPTTFRKG
jgi:AraC-like DNA-binding protein